MSDLVISMQLLENLQAEFSLFDILVWGAIPLVAVGVAVFAALLSVGYFEYLGGKHKPASPSVTKDELRTRMLNLNDPDRPFHLVEGTDTDLVVEWKLAEAKWHGVLNKNGVKAWYKARLLLDESRHTVRCNEETGEINWSIGMDGSTPRATYTRGFFRGRMLFGRRLSFAYGFKYPIYRDPTSFGKVFSYDFNLDTVRGYLEKVVEDSGWEFVPVAGKRNAVYRN